MRLGLVPNILHLAINETNCQGDRETGILVDTNLPLLLLEATKSLSREEIPWAI